MLFLEGQPPASAGRKNDDPVARVQDIGEVCPVCHNVRLYDRTDYFSR